LQGLILFAAINTIKTSLTMFNILFHSWAYFPNGGGVGSYFFNIAQALADHGHNVTVLTGRVAGLPEEEKNGNITILRRYREDQIGSKAVLQLVLDIIDRYSIDFIEGADYLGDCSTLLDVKKRPPVLIKVHGCNILNAVYESQILFFWQRLFIRIAFLRNWPLILREKKSIERADFLTAPSLRIIQELEKQGIHMPTQRLVIPNPIPIDRFDEQNQEAPVPTLLLVARLDIGKGVQYIPSILKQLIKEFPDLVLEIAGGDSYARGLGHLKEWLVKATADLAHHLSFLGHLDKNELSKAYKRSWVVIVPSRWDNFPTVVLEAMSLGKPVVASPHGGMPEMLTGTFCKTALPDTDAFAEEIACLLRNEDLRKKAGISMIRKARADYAPEVIASIYTDLIERLLKDGR
jgi:glycogen synthase